MAHLHAITGLNATFAWGSEQQLAFNEIKKALFDATALAQPDSQGEFVLDTDASAVAISGILHQWQGLPGERRLRPILYGSKKLTATQAKYGAPKLEMYAAYHFIVKNHSYLCPRKFTLRVDNQTLSWLKTYSTDQALIGMWIMTLEKYHFRVKHRPRTQHRNADGLSKRTNDYLWREQQLEKLPPVAERWNFLSQEEYEQLPTAPWFDLQGRAIPNHPELPEHLKNLQPTPLDVVQRVIRRAQRNRRRDQWQKALEAPLPQPPPPILHAHEHFYPDYPEDWIDVTEEAHHDYLLPTHINNVPSRTTYHEKYSRSNQASRTGCSQCGYRTARANPHGSWHQGPTPRTESRRACPCAQKIGEWGKHRSGYISRGRTCTCPELFQAKEGATFPKF